MSIRQTLSFIALMSLAVFILTGCVSTRPLLSIAGLVAPEHKTTLDNVLNMLQDEQIVTEVQFFVETPDGRRYSVHEITLGARPVETTWPLNEVPPGVLRRISKEPLPESAAEQRRILAEALKEIPTTPETKEKK